VANANFSLFFFHFYTVSSVLANVGAGIFSCEGDCGACQGGGANYFDCEGLSLVGGGDGGVVVVVWLGDDADEAVICANTAAHGFIV